ncbi:NnrU family protein [Celeribacter arenosi]|uniref:NnrU family protein n=1 Tax=Celeribacter arenosi TaxID=792649 RepID=A0ABP7K244_9RHOB
MILLILGVLLWSGAHLFKRLAPDARARMGDKAKGPVALALALSLVFMVVGYRGAETYDLYALPGWTVHLNNLLMVIAVVLLGLGNSKSRLRAKMRHPMLTGVIVWGVAHLLTNADAASFVLFGAMIIWAATEMVLINRQVHSYVPYDGGSPKGDMRLALISLAVFIVIAGLHWWIGVYPFPM